MAQHRRQHRRVDRGGRAGGPRRPALRRPEVPAAGARADEAGVPALAAVAHAGPGPAPQDLRGRRAGRLAASITSRGMLQPIRVRWDEAGQSWVIVAGERRWRAAIARWAWTRSPASRPPTRRPSEILIDQLIENCMREDLDPIEQAEAFRVLMDRTGMDPGRAGRAAGHVRVDGVAGRCVCSSCPTRCRRRCPGARSRPAAAYERARSCPCPRPPPDAPPGEVRKLATRRARRRAARRRPATSTATRPGVLRGRQLPQARRRAQGLREAVEGGHRRPQEGGILNPSGRFARKKRRGRGVSLGPFSCPDAS